jgi:hypothetical protein
MKPTKKSQAIYHRLQKILLICGIIAALLYISVDAFLASSYEGYSYTDQAISELSAIGAPTRVFWVTMTFLFNPLIIAFGIGVWKVADKRNLRITGILLAIWGVSGFAWLLFPMNMRGNIGSTTDTGHLVMAAVTVLLITAFIGFGSGARAKWFRIYSILTLLVMLIFGGIVGTMAPAVKAQLPTPWMGMMERISVFSSMIWMLVLAVVLLRKEKEQDINIRKKR